MEPREEYDLTVSLKVKITQEDIDDIMVSALEGGVNYWVSEAEVIEEKRVADWGHEQIARGGILILHDMESEKEYELNLILLLNGVRIWIQNGDAFRCGAIVDGKIDSCQVDAIQADRIIQYAIFREIIYC